MIASHHTVSINSRQAAIDDLKEAYFIDTSAANGYLEARHTLHSYSQEIRSYLSCLEQEILFRPIESHISALCSAFRSVVNILLLYSKESPSHVQWFSTQLDLQARKFSEDADVAFETSNDYSLDYIAFLRTVYQKANDSWGEFNSLFFDEIPIKYPEFFKMKINEQHHAFNELILNYSGMLALKSALIDPTPYLTDLKRTKYTLLELFHQTKPAENDILNTFKALIEDDNSRLVLDNFVDLTKPTIEDCVFLYGMGGRELYDFAKKKENLKEREIEKWIALQYVSYQLGRKSLSLKVVGGGRAMRSLEDIQNHLDVRRAYGNMFIGKILRGDDCHPEELEQYVSFAIREHWDFLSSVINR